MPKLSSHFGISALVLLMMITGQNCEMLTQVVNGDVVKAESGKWPFIVALMKQNKEGVLRVHCGGSMLNQDTILTAAHCLINKAEEDLTVLVGHEDIRLLRDQEKGYTRGVKKLISHPKFEIENDIAIIKLDSPLEFKNQDKVKPVCLPATSDDSLYDFQGCMIMGWGRNENMKKTAMLNDAVVPILDNDTCVKYQVSDKPYNPESMFCAGYLEGGIDTCQGDSGGPLVCPFKNDPEKYAQLGIVSFGNGCAKANNPGYYTKVSYFIDWIKDRALED